LNATGPYKTIVDIGLWLEKILPARGGFFAYVIALALAGGALLLRLTFADIDAGYQYVSFFPVVAIAAIIGGFWPGVFAAILLALFAQYFFTYPYYAFSGVVWQSGIESILVFLLDGIIVCSAIEAMHRYRVKSNEKLKEVQQQNNQIRQLQQEAETLRQCNQLLMMNASDSVMIVDTKGNASMVSDAFCRMLGYTQEEMANGNVADWNAQLSFDEWQAIFNDLIGKSIQIETLYRRKNGLSINVEISATGVMIAGQECIYASYRDITESKKAELREGELRFRGTLEQAAVGIVHASLDGHLKQINQKFCDIVGYTREELLEMRFQDIIYSDDLGGSLHHLQKLISGEIRTYAIEKRYVRKNRSLVWVDLTVSLLRDTDGTPKYTIGVVEDITERKSLERQMRDLSMHLQTVREEEKASLAREIHDNLGGTLTALKMDVYWLAGEMLAYQVAEPLLSHVNSMSKLLDDAVDVTRRVITDLRPTILDDLGLVAAINWQAGQFQKRSGIRCRVTCIEGCEGDLDKIQTINLFRILQESLTNVARHSGASRVEIDLYCEDEKTVLTVIDNGCGLPEGHVISQNSFGMLGMRERVGQLDGEIYFSGSPDGGFCVTVILPQRTGSDERIEHDTHSDC
jgi:PAS domain S-box-containing protein